MYHFKAIKSFVIRLSESRFDQFTEGFTDYLVSNEARLGLDSTQVSDLRSLRGQYVINRMLTVNPGVSTREANYRLSSTRETFSWKIIDFYNSQILTNPQVNYVDLVGMGLPIREVKNQKSPGFSSDEIPQVKIFVENNGLIRVKCLNRSQKCALPTGAKLVELRYTFATVLPASTKDYDQSIFFSSAYAEFNIDPNRELPFMFVIVRWVGHKTQSFFCQPIPALVMG